MQPAHWIIRHSFNMPTHGTAKPSVIQISLHNPFPHPTSQLLTDFEQNLLVNKTATFLKALLVALHASSHPSSLFLLQLGTCTPNKATAHQAACFAVCFHTTELAVPTGCWKRAKENYLACHISSLATASQEEGLKLNGNGNKIQPSDPCRWVSPTTTLPSQAATRPPRQKKTCHEACGSDSREFS